MIRYAKSKLHKTNNKEATKAKQVKVEEDSKEEVLQMRFNQGSSRK